MPVRLGSSVRAGGPVRTCVGCRQRREVGALLRVARRSDGTLVIDRTAEGRGAWLCRDETTNMPRQACVLKAERSRSFARAFRAPVVEGTLATLVAVVVPRSPGGEQNMRGWRSALPTRSRPEKGLT
ncbi:MAG: YlxR family protein [Thermoplasmata archaeon]